MQNSFMNAFQFEVLSSLRTGNPLIDAFILSFFTFIVSQIFRNSHLRKLRDLWREWHSEGKVAVYTIERSQPQQNPPDGRYRGNDENKLCYERNKLYYALAWYIRKEKCIQGHPYSHKVFVHEYDPSEDDMDDGIDERSTKHSECILIPTSSMVIKYEDFIIEGEHDRMEDDKGKEIKDKFILTVDHALAHKMEGFFDVVLNEYIKHETHLLKGHKLYSLTYGDYNTRLYWASSPFQSYTNITNVILDGRMEKILEADIDTFLQSHELYNQHGKVWKRGYLFYGPPGTGKTSLVKGMATKTQYNIYNVKLSRFKTDSNMEKLLKQIPSSSIILFEDIDCMGSVAHKRQKQDGDESSSEETSDVEDENDVVGNNESDVAITPIDKDIEKPTLSTLLNFIDGIDSPEGIIVVMTTNHVEKLDPALLRDGRVDFKLRLNFATRQQICDLADQFFNMKLTLEDLAEIPDGKLSPATVSGVMMDLAFKWKRSGIDGHISDDTLWKDELLTTLRQQVQVVTNAL